MRIKWPNDVYGNRLKIGGILCQSAYRDQAFHVVIGTGINLSNRHPTTCIDALVEEQHKKLGLPGTPATIPPEVQNMLMQPTSFCQWTPCVLLASHTCRRGLQDVQTCG